jgi:hypothetical protein
MWCSWAAEVPTDPVKLRHICERVTVKLAETPDLFAQLEAARIAYEALPESERNRPCGPC